MNEKKSLRELQFASLQNEHEKKVIEAFMESPKENVASVTLEVGGIEHTILIHDEDYPKLYALLCQINDAENERLTKLLNETERGIGSVTLEEIDPIAKEIVSYVKNDPLLLKRVLGNVDKKRKQGGSMKFETMKQICALSKCNVTESDTAITFKFPDAEVIVNRNFDVGMTEAALFVMRGWLKTLREVLDSNNENDGSKNDK